VTTEVPPQRAGILTRLAADFCHFGNRLPVVRGHGLFRSLAESLSSGKICRVKRQGVLLDLYVGDRRRIVDRAELFHAWQPETADLLKKICKPGMTCVDVGANIGIFTLQMARHVGPSGRVFAFEPVPDFFQRLSHHVAINNLQSYVQVERLAASDSVTVGTIFASAATASCTRVSTHGVQPVEFHSVRLDDFLAGQRVDFLKIDTDGFELNVLGGAMETIERCRPLMLIEAEVNDTDDDSLRKCRRLVELLLGLKYRVFSEDESHEFCSADEVTPEWNCDILCRPA
jgi:FkbM family methyltransferase